MLQLKLDEIEINNYKSVYTGKFEFDNQTNNTYIFVGKNGTGKSKLLEAISIPHDATGQNYITSCTKKYKNKNEPITIKYTSFTKHHRTAYIEEFEKLVEVPRNFWRTFRIDSISIVYSLVKNSREYIREVEYGIQSIRYEKYCYRQKQQEEISTQSPQKYEIIERDEDTDNTLYKDLNEEFIKNTILNKIFNFNLNTNYWAANDGNIIKDSIDLSEFKSNPDTCIPIKNAFYHAGYKTSGDIRNILNESINDEVLLQDLETTLSKCTNEYIKRIWRDKELKVNLKFSIRKDSTNQYKIRTIVSNMDEISGIFSVEDMSDGFKQFVSIILGLDIKDNCNNIIAIDEPEVHLHPSAAMYLKEKLLEFGNDNYVFFSTHTPFMLDAKVPQRHYKITQENCLTTLKRIEPNKNMCDDDLTEELFGINTLRDFYAPNRMLVEGQCEKTIIDYAIKLNYTDKCIVITNARGDNILATASFINIKEVENVLTILDSDNRGSAAKNEILAIKGIYNDKNVYCLNDIVKNLPENATIEDLLDVNYVAKQFNDFIKEKFSIKMQFTPSDGAILNQISIFCSINDVRLSKSDMKDLKTRIAENFNIKKNALKTKNPYLFELVEFIVKYFDSINHV